MIGVIEREQSQQLTPYDEREVSSKQKIYNRFKFVSDVPNFSIEEINEGQF